MRIPTIPDATRISSIVLLVGLAFCPVVSAQTQSQSQPCPTPDTANTSTGGANNGAAAPNSVKDAAANAKTALKNLGSIFGKKKTPDVASPAPCPSPVAGTPASGSASAPAGPGPQPGSSPNQPTSPSGQSAPPGQPAPAAGGGGNAAPWSPDSGAATGANATAGSAAPFASSRPPDFSKLPDIGGALRIGLSHDEAQAAMVKMHPGYKVAPGPTGTLQAQPGRLNQLGGVRGQFFLDDAKLQVDNTFAFYTMPPTKQQAFVVARYYPYPKPGIDKLKLIAALRQKYGPETKATHEWGATREETGDDKINAMYWAYDEQGHVIASDKGASTWPNPPFGCPVWGASTSGINIWVGMADQYRLNTLPPATFCDTIVLLSVSLGQGPYVFSTGTEIDDHVLLRRAVQIAGDAAKADAQKQHQQEIDQSKQAKPSL
jgi:hypothetical protein